MAGMLIPLGEIIGIYIDIRTVIQIIYFLYFLVISAAWSLILWYERYKYRLRGKYFRNFPGD